MDRKEPKIAQVYLPNSSKNAPNHEILPYACNFFSPNSRDFYEANKCKVGLLN